jgi:hypothetical protein
MDRLLSGAGSTIQVLTYDTNGALADVDGVNAPSVVVRDSAGTSVLTPTGVRDSAGTYHAVIPVTQTILDLYTVTWTWPSAAIRTTQYEVVGSFLFSDAQLRAFDAELVAGTYTPAKVRDVRETVEDRFSRACQVSFTRRGFRELFDGNGTCSLFLRQRMAQSLVSVKVSGTSIAVGSFTLYPYGKLEYTNCAGSFTWGTRNVEVLYEGGFAAVPSDIADAAMRYARYLLVPGANKNDERITGISTDVGFARFSMPGKNAPTGIPDVDVVLGRYDFSGNIG